MTEAENSGECSVACMCCCINAGRLAIDLLSWAVVSWRLTSWDGIVDGLRRREITAT